MDVLLDESVPSSIEKALEERGLKPERFEIGASDKEVIDYAVENEVPVITRDQGDFVRLGRKFDHFGILIDKHMHLREDADMIARAVEYMLTEIREDLSNNTWYLSDFYGR